MAVHSCFLTIQSDQSLGDDDMKAAKRLPRSDGGVRNFSLHNYVQYNLLKNNKELNCNIFT
jgi:hypothetical protein